MLSEDFFKDDRHVALYIYHYEGVPGLKQFKKECIAAGKSQELLDYVEELIAKRPTDPQRVLY